MSLSARHTIYLLAIVALLSASCGKEQSAQQYLQRGMTLYDEGNLVKARLEFKNALQIDPKDAEAWLMLAKVAEQQQEWRSAYSAYAKTVELTPGNHEARIKLGNLLLAGNNVDEALAEADAVLATNPKNPAALALRGSATLRQGNSDAALTDAVAALQQAPEQRDALALVAQIRIQQDDFPAAKQALETALAVHSDDQRLMLALAGVSERLGDSQRTTSILRQLIEREPADLTHRTRLALYLAASGQADAAEQVLRDAVDALPGEVQPKLQLVELLRATQDGDAAARALDSFIAADPSDNELSFALATIRTQAGDIEQAQQVYRELIERDGDGLAGLRARGKLAALLLAQGQVDDASALAAEVLAKDDQDADALLIRAAIALQDNDADQAIGDLRTILKNQPESIGALRLLAQAHVARQELALAEDALKKAIELAPDDPASYLQLAGLRARAGDPDGAGLILEQLLSRDPNSAVAQTALAQVQQGQPDTDALEATAQQILDSRPEHPLGYYLSGLVLQRRGQLEASVEQFETALDKEPKAAEPLVALARSLLALERYDQAEQRLRQALDGSADNIVATNLLGEVYLAAGRLADARAQYDKAIAQRPGAPLAYERVARLQVADGDAAAAVDTLTTGIEATKGSQLLVSALPPVLEQAGRYEEAIDAYEAVLAANPNADAAANNLAMLLANHRADDTESLARARTLVQRFEGSEQTPFLDTLGWVYYRSGDYQRAAEVLEQVQATGETTPERQFHLGMAYLKLGKADDAKPLLAAAVGAEQPFPGIEEARAALAPL